MNPMTWLVTGAAGFVGAHVCRDLLKRGYVVCGVDNLFVGTLNNVDDLLQHDRFHWVEQDIGDTCMKDVFEIYRPSHVVHLAAVVSVPLCESNPDLARRVNVEGFNMLLKLSHQSGVKQFIYASSSAVYGNTQKNFISETDPAKPISVYGKTKLDNENAVQEIKHPGMTCIGLRFFNLFGTSKNAQSSYAAVIPLWIDALRAGKQPIIYGDGSATRDFCHIDNVLHAMDVLQHLPEGDHVLNIGTGKPVSLNTLFHALCDTLNIKQEPHYQPWRPEDIMHSCANIERAKMLCGYEPMMMLREGLQKVIAS
jgi:UDP-N-acetylglucosamine 4-epimerase